MRIRFKKETGARLPFFLVKIGNDFLGKVLLAGSKNGFLAKAQRRKGSSRRFEEWGVR